MIPFGSFLRITHDSAAERQEITVGEHSCLGSLVVSRAPFPILATRLSLWCSWTTKTVQRGRVWSVRIAGKR